jgi:hypothetical protein
MPKRKPIQNQFRRTQADIKLIAQIPIAITAHQAKTVSSESPLIFLPAYALDNHVVCGAGNP